MNTYECIIDYLESARIHAGAEFEKLCNKGLYVDACVFQIIRDSISNNVKLLKSYLSTNQKSEVK